MIGHFQWKLRIRISERTVKTNKEVSSFAVWKDPSDALSNPETEPESNSGGQAESSQEIVEFRDELSREGSEDGCDEAPFLSQQPPEFYLNNTETADDDAEAEDENESDVAYASSALLPDRLCIQCDGLITRPTADFCDACLESND